MNSRSQHFSDRLLVYPKYIPCVLPAGRNIPSGQVLSLWLISRHSESKGSLETKRKRTGRSFISMRHLCSDLMIPEKMARMMYAKNREKIVQHKRGFIIVNFYNNYDVKIKENTDDVAEFYFRVPRESMHETLDAEFNKALTDYLTYGKNRE
jgi:hypothetical protein